MHDETFGDIDYDYGWVGEYSYRIFQQDAKAKLFIPCDEGEEIEDAQRQAFARFATSKERLAPLSEQAIFDHYIEIVDEYRERIAPGSQAWGSP